MPTDYDDIDPADTQLDDEEYDPIKDELIEDREDPINICETCGGATYYDEDGISCCKTCNLYEEDCVCLEDEDLADDDSGD